MPTAVGLELVEGDEMEDGEVNGEGELEGGKAEGGELEGGEVEGREVEGGEVEGGEVEGGKGEGCEEDGEAEMEEGVEVKGWGKEGKLLDEQREEAVPINFCKLGSSAAYSEITGRPSNCEAVGLRFWFGLSMS